MEKSKIWANYKSYLGRKITFDSLKKSLLCLDKEVKMGRYDVDPYWNGESPVFDYIEEPRKMTSAMFRLVEQEGIYNELFDEATNRHYVSIIVKS
jgi:hypothetical protein